MRNFVTIAALAAVAILSSCSKEASKRCYTCTLQQTTYATGMPAQNATSTSTICDMTEDDKKKTEQAGTATSHATSGSVSATVVQTMSCR